MHVLVVEDEDLLAEYLKLALTKAGHIVDYAADGMAAEQKIRSKKYDVIILDIILPLRNGLEVCRNVRKDSITTPIIVLSSQDSEESRIEGLDAGADDYMIKPFSYPELEARLRALHRRPTEILDETISLGRITVSFNKHKVWADSHEVALRTKEFALVEYLVRNKNRIVTREELLKNVWGVNVENASNRVDACIKEIRSKLGKDCIRTVHGSGYTINT